MQHSSFSSMVRMKQGELGALCQQYHVLQLEIFGSAAGDTFNPDASDLDFLVEFDACSPNEHYERYFGLLESLEELFARSVDLVETKAMRNPYFIRGVNETRTPVHGP